MEGKFRKNCGDNVLTYPLDQKQVDELKPCRIVNPMVGKHHNVRPDPKFNAKKAGQEVGEVALMVKQGIFPFEMMDKYYPYKNMGSFPREIPEPLKIEGLSFDDPQGLANIVHMDSPTDMPNLILKWLTHPMYGQNANVKEHTDKYINFLETVPNMLRKIAIGVDDGLKKSFEIKWYYGEIRPEEILNGLTGITGPLFTAYREGCPPHCSFIAGHTGAGIGGSLPILESFPKLSYYQKKQILDTIYVWIMARMFAGVHNADDQLAGYVAFQMDEYIRPSLIQKYRINKK